MNLSELSSLGFNQKQATRLIGNRYLPRRKGIPELRRIVNGISKSYGITEKKTIELISRQPSFIGYDPEKTLRNITRAYFTLDSEKSLSENVREMKETRRKVKQAIIKQPSFAGLDHERVLREVVETYGCEKERATKKILKFPEFAGLDHERVLREVVETYGCEKEEDIKRAIITRPDFSWLDHERVLREATKIYGDREKVKKAIIQQPSFAGLDHERVLRQKSRIGKLIGLSEEEIVNLLLEKPYLSGLSVRRDLALIDIWRKRIKKDENSPEEILNSFLNYATRSPYIPGTKKRISQMERMLERKLTEEEEPPIVGYLRPSLTFEEAA